MSNMVMAIRNDRGLRETNYILSLTNFKSLFANDCNEKSWLEFVSALERVRSDNETTGQKEFGTWVNFYMTPNDSFVVAFIPSIAHAKALLRGAYNDSVDKMLKDNWNEKMSINENLNQYIDWYWWVDVENCDKDYINKCIDKRFITTEKHCETPIDIILQLYDNSTGERKKSFEEYIKSYKKTCLECGALLEWGDSEIPGKVYESAASISEWDICSDCMAAYCKETKCSRCDYLEPGISQWMCKFSWLKNNVC